jgi:voltage-gated potassium channel
MTLIGQTPIPPRDEALGILPPLTGGWRERWFHIIFGHDTRAGAAFDMVLLGLIVVSVVVAMMDSIERLHIRYGGLFYVLEWMFTLLFTAEYAVRLAVVRHPMRYAASFYGIIDLVAVLPTYVAFFVPGAQYLLVLRALRVLRIFKILHLSQFVRESGILITALQRSGRKIFIFLFAIVTIVTVFGAVMYLIEGPAHGFTSIPMAMYWAIVTVGTVGYGDIAPGTNLGRLVTSVLILIGYGIIAVPTGIYAMELISAARQGYDDRACAKCGLLGHDIDALCCRRCGQELPHSA